MYYSLKKKIQRISEWICEKLNVFPEQFTLKKKGKKINLVISQIF